MIDGFTGKHSDARRRRGDCLDGGHAVPGDMAPALFAGSRPVRLLPLSQGEEESWLAHPHPGDLEEGVGGGYQDSVGGRLSHGHQVVEQMLQKM